MSGGDNAVETQEEDEEVTTWVDREEDVEGFFGKREEQRLVRALAEKGDGSSLRGWRRECDPEGIMEVPFKHFAEVCVRLGLNRKTQELYLLPRDFTDITLDKALSGLGHIMAAFRRWMTTRFGSHIEFFEALASPGHAEVTLDMFVSFVEREGFDGTTNEIAEIFGFCDLNLMYVLTSDDVVCLETDQRLRLMELTQIKKRKRLDREEFMVSIYYDKKFEDADCQTNSGSRSGVRPWDEGVYEAMPEIERRRHFDRERARSRLGLQIRTDFLRGFRRQHGTEILGWRKVLDPRAKFVVSEASFRHYCRHIDFEGDIRAMWYCFDKLGSGIVRLENFSPHAACLFANFRCWATRIFGSCANMWESPVGVARAGMDRRSFAEALRRHGCPSIAGSEGRKHLWFLFKSLDFHCCGFLAKADLEWLDSWEPTEWLCAEPHQDSFEELKSLMLRQHDANLLRAWLEIDFDGKNRLSWEQFCKACDRLKFRSNVPGVWRRLDKNFRGWITIGDLDEEISQILYSFKDWAHARFGSVVAASRAIASGDTTVYYTLEELTNARAKFKWEGDPDVLFSLLTNNGETVPCKGSGFLDAWVPQDEVIEEETRHVCETLWQEMLEAAPRAARPNASLNSPSGDSADIANSTVCGRAEAGNIAKPFARASPSDADSDPSYSATLGSRDTSPAPASRSRRNGCRSTSSAPIGNAASPRAGSAVQRTSSFAPAGGAASPTSASSMRRSNSRASSAASASCANSPSGASTARRRFSFGSLLRPTGSYTRSMSRAETAPTIAAHSPTASLAANLLSQRLPGPETHCSPRSAFSGAPYAKPVLLSFPVHCMAEADLLLPNAFGTAGKAVGAGFSRRGGTADLLLPNAFGTAGKAVGAGFSRRGGTVAFTPTEEQGASGDESTARSLSNGVAASPARSSCGRNSNRGRGDRVNSRPSSCGSRRTPSSVSGRLPLLIPNGLSEGCAFPPALT